EWRNVTRGGKYPEDFASGVFVDGSVVQNVGQAPVRVANRQRVVRDKAPGERLLISLAGLSRLREIVPKIRRDQPLPRDAGDFDSRFVHVGDFALRADRYQRIQTGFDQAPGILRGLLLGGDVPDRAHRQCAILGFQRAQADLDGEFGSVSAQSVQLKAGSHGTCSRFREKTGAMVRVLSTEALRHEYFHFLPDQVTPGMAKNSFGLGVDQHDFTFPIHDYNRVGRRFEQALELEFRALAIGNVADRAHRQHAVLGFQGAQTDLDLEFGPILALAVKFQSGAHGACGGLGEEAGPVSGTGSPEALRNEYFDRLAQQFVACVAKEFLGLGVDEHDPAVFVDDHDGIRSGLEQSPEFFLGFFAAGDIPRSGEYTQDVAPSIFIN